MFKRLLLISILFMSLMALWGTEASAWPPSLLGTGWRPGGSIICTTTWIGISNTELKPTDVLVTVILDQVVVYYKNPGDKKGGLGVPFIFAGTIGHLDTLTDGTLQGKGKYTSEIPFSDGDLLGAIPQDVLDAHRPNPGWTPYDIDVISFKGIVQGFADVDDGCPNSYPPESCFDTNEEEIVHAEFDCTLEGNVYSCTSLEDWEWSKNDPVYTP